MNPSRFLAYCVNSILFLLLFFFTAEQLPAQTTLDQRLSILRNDSAVDGELQIAYEMKGTNLPLARTLGSITADIVYDSQALEFLSAEDWELNYLSGYDVFTSSISNSSSAFVRIGITGTTVNAMLNGTPAGYEVQSSDYARLVTLRFRILSTDSPVSLFIDGSTNQAGLFRNPSNNPRTGVIDNQTLSAPININNTPLPVELTSFSGTVMGSNVHLKWTTATEVNSFGFELQRAAIPTGSGDLQLRSWESIAFIEASGNSNINRQYSFTDRLVRPGRYAYRLKQIDNGGEFDYSQQCEVSIDVPRGLILEQNFPNPFNPSTTISFSLDKAGSVSLRVFNTLGETVAVLKDQTLEAGFHNVTFEAGDMESGIYLYELRAGSQRIIKKMVLLR